MVITGPKESEQDNMTGMNVIFPPSSFVLQITLKLIQAAPFIKRLLSSCYVMRNSFIHVMYFMFQKMYFIKKLMRLCDIFNYYSFISSRTQSRILCTECLCSNFCDCTVQEDFIYPGY
jgi:hypothetical protein